MAERSTVTQVTQIGVEATPGTAVAATKRLGATAIRPKPSVEVDVFRPDGYKFSTLASPVREWGEAAIEGRPTYNELTYLLAACLLSATPTQILDGATPTGAYRWTFTPSTTAENAPKTLTVERGSSYRAHRMPYGVVTDLGIDFGTDGLALDGTMIGRRIEDGVTLTSAGITELTPVPIMPTQVDVFLDNTSGGLGTTKLARLMSAAFDIGSRFSPLWVLDSSQTSWVVPVEGVPDASIEITPQADAQGMALLTALRAGDTRFVRIKATGPTIYIGGVTVKNSLTIDAAVKVRDVGDFSDEDGTQVLPWTFELVHDAAWAKAFTVELVNTLTAL